MGPFTSHSIIGALWGPTSDSQKRTGRVRPGAERGRQPRDRSQTTTQDVPVVVAIPPGGDGGDRADALALDEPAHHGVRERVVGPHAEVNGYGEGQGRAGGGPADRREQVRARDPR